MASLSMRGSGSASQIASLLSVDIQNSGLSCELIDTVTKNVNGSNVIVMVFEKYYMRSSNRASLTVIITEDNDNVYVDAIGSGGGQGVIFRFSWWTEESFVNTLENILNKYGFTH